MSDGRGLSRSYAAALRDAGWQVRPQPDGRHSLRGVAGEHVELLVASDA
ncbi:hypothetical protein [Stenotrophomonas sp. MYb238]|nr:hypothetical protein [Stenotrophomonas sp. MYb238]